MNGPTPERLQAEIDRLVGECQKRNATISAQRDELRDRESTILDLRREIDQLKAALSETTARIKGWVEQEYRGTSYFAGEMADVDRWRKLVTR